MRPPQLIFAAFLLAATSCVAEIKNSDCLECHSDKTLTSTNANGVVRSLFVDPAILAGSIHKTNTCASCHSDITGKHPDDNVAARPVACARCHGDQNLSYGASVHALALRNQTTVAGHQAPGCADCHGSHAILPPTAAASPLYFSNLERTCGKCHEQESQDVIASVHGKATDAGRREAATCIDCHSEHKIQALKNSSPLVISEEICGKCHASGPLNTKFKLPSNSVKTFFESYHGLAAQNGSLTAANCASCHGVHKILASTDPRSTIYKDNLVMTCGKCHPGANANFVQGKVHLDLNTAKAGKEMGEKINWWVRKIYLAMIVGVIGFMAAHNGLIFARKTAARARLHPRTLVRMDSAQRAQHFVLAASFIILAWTGFALKFPESFTAQALGSDEMVRRWIHRIAGVVLMVAGLYHIGYLVGAREGRRLVKDMAPAPKDLRDLIGNALYLAGWRKTKPKFTRFGYAEKMEYWAVVWGTIIMGATGLIIWFKIDSTRFVHRWVVDVATTIHYYEAVLACLAILVWHLYHVIFDPDVYPINRAAVDGRVSEEWLEEEHPLDPANKPSSDSP